MDFLTTIVDPSRPNNFYCDSFNDQKAQENALPSFKALTGNESKEEEIMVKEVSAAPTLLGRVKNSRKSVSKAIYDNRYQIAGGFALFLIGIILGRTKLSSLQKNSTSGGLKRRGREAPGDEWKPTPSGPKLEASNGLVPENNSSNDSVQTGISASKSKYDGVVVSMPTIRDVNTNVTKIEKRINDIVSHMSSLSSYLNGKMKLPADDNSFKLNPV